MDSDSDYERGVQDTEPSTPIEGFSIESLIQRVDEFRRRDHMDTIERLTAENLLLQQVIVKYQTNWCLTIETLEMTHRAVLTLQKALETCINEDIAAEKEWMPFWGIKKESAGWI
jgi:hypothetical protein